MLFHSLFFLLSTLLPNLCAVKQNIFSEVIRTQQDFVDKSEMLRIFFDQNYTETPNHPFYYLSVPRQFAKSINIDMLHTFCEKKFNQKGDAINPVDTEAYSFFKDLKIAKNESIISEHLARYIVVQLDLMAIAYMQTTVEEAVVDINSILSIELSTHPRLQNPADELELTSKDTEFIRKLENKGLSLHDLETSLFNLIRILYKAYNHTQLVLLVDDYDETAFGSYLVPSSFCTGVFKTINEMFTYAMVHGQAYLKFVLIQGIGTLAYSLDDSLRAILKHCPFLGIHPFTPFYGFTEQEVEELLTKHGLSDMEKQSIHGHYKGYVSANRKIVLYNPHSVINCLYDYDLKKQNPSEPFKPDSYVRSGDWISRIYEFLKNSQFRVKVEDLLKNGSLQYSVNKLHKPEAILELEKLREAKFNESSPHHVDIFITQIFEMGFLSHGPEAGTYVIPNKEVRDLYEQKMNEYKNNDRVKINEDP